MHAQQWTLAQNTLTKIATNPDHEGSVQVSIQNTGANAVLLGGSNLAGTATAGWSIAATSGTVQILLAPGDSLYAFCTGAGGSTMNVLVSP